MLTLFATPKPFSGHIRLIQRNAIRSWLSLDPKCDIILFGDDEGTGKAAAEFGVRHIPKVNCNEFGTPLLDSLFQMAQDLAKYRVMAYVNADIILLDDFVRAVQRIQRPSFLMVGQRRDIEINVELDFGNPNSQSQLRCDINKRSVLHGRTGIDYFVFDRGLFRDIPPFAIGRTAWDNWLIYRARSLGVPVIDATEVITAVHQNHDYLHHADGAEGVWKGPESKYNSGLSGTVKHAFSIADATCVLTKNGLRAALDFAYIWRRVYTLSLWYPFLAPLQRLLNILLKASRPIRAKIGFTLEKVHS